MADKKHGAAFVAMLSDISSNPDRAKAFEANPDAVMDAHGLSADQKTRMKHALTDLKAGNTATLRKVVGDETVHPDTCFFTIP